MEPDTLSKRIYHRILAQAPAGVWSRADFLDLGTANAVEKALQRLVNAGQIRRPHRGLYDITTHSTLTGGLVFPTRSAFIDAIARRDKLRVVIDGLTAANDLGLTTAVPARSTIYADSRGAVGHVETDLDMARRHRTTQESSSLQYVGASSSHPCRKCHPGRQLGRPVVLPDAGVEPAFNTRKIGATFYATADLKARKIR
jgi:hypothetical protein